MVSSCVAAADAGATAAAVAAAVQAKLMRIRFLSAVLGSFRGPPAAGALKEVRRAVVLKYSVSYSSISGLLVDVIRRCC